MKRISLACLVVAALVLGQMGLGAADTAKFRYLMSLYFDDKGAGLNLPEGVACDAKGQVVVGDTGNDRLLRFTYADKAASGGSTIKIAQLTAPPRVPPKYHGGVLDADAKQP